MIWFILRVFALGAVFAYFFPAFVPGVHLHGGFWPEAVVCGFLFALVGIGLVILLTVFTVLTLGLGSIITYIGLLVLPILQLQTLAYYFPERLTVDGWESATVGGICIWVVNVIFQVLRSSK